MDWRSPMASPGRRASWAWAACSPPGPPATGQPCWCWCWWWAAPASGWGGPAPAVWAASLATAGSARLTGATAVGDFAGMLRRAPFPALVLALGVSSLAGLPPLIGFFGRFLILVAAVESGYTWLGLLGLLNLLLLGGWAIRVARLVALEASPTEAPEPAPDWRAPAGPGGAHPRGGGLRF